MFKLKKQNKKELILVPTLTLLLMVTLFMVCSKANEVTLASTEAGLASAEASSAISATGDWWSQDLDCSGCHARNVESFTDSNLSASVHGQEGYGDCVNCHSLETLEEAHQGAMDIPEYIPLKLPQSACLACHGTYEDLIALTKDSTVFETPDGTFVNPHTQPTETHQENVECYSCHKMHSEPDPKGYCYTCHHTGDLTCYTCH